MSDNTVFVEFGPGTLQQVLTSITAVVNEAKIRFDPDGMNAQVVDKANVASVQLDMLPNAFSDYTAPGLTVALDVDQMESIVRKVDPTSKAVLVIKPESHTLDLQLDEYEFDLPLLDPDSLNNKRDSTSVEPPAKIETSSENIRQSLDIAQTFSDHITVGVDTDEESLYMRAEGDIGGMNRSVSSDHLDQIRSAPAHSTYSLAYLESIVSSAPPGKQISISLGEEYPAKIQYDFASGDGRAVYVLAPRVV